MHEPTLCNPWTAPNLSWKQANVPSTQPTKIFFQVKIQQSYLPTIEIKSNTCNDIGNMAWLNAPYPRFHFSNGSQSGTLKTLNNTIQKVKYFKAVPNVCFNLVFTISSVKRSLLKRFSFVFVLHCFFFEILWEIYNQNYLHDCKVWFDDCFHTLLDTAHN